MSTRTIPVVSLAALTAGSPADRADFVRVFGGALREFGFVSVVDHGVPREQILDVYTDIGTFFARPEEEKLTTVVPGAGGNRGYVAFGKEHAKNSPIGDLKEFFHVGREIPSLGASAKNAWPVHPASFQERTTTLYKALEGVAGKLLEALAEHFSLPADTFSKMIVGGNSILRLIHYPKLADRFVPGAVRAAEHEDINLITLLCEATTSGLEILTRDGTWLAVEAPPGHIVVDSGDMLARITGGVVPSTTHRVVNPPSPEADTVRYSLPFFVHPFPDCVLEPLDLPGAGPKAPTVTAQGFLEERLRAIGLLGK
jgi:isopenicillin N synthase-like dioxygenase